MTAPERRRPLPALAVIAALCVLTAIVWFRVLHRTDAGGSATASGCPTPTPTPVAKPTVLPTPPHITVVVLNSTHRNGLAKATKQLLTKRGFRVTLATDDSAQFGGHGLIKGVAEIRYGTSALPGATLLSYYIPRATLKPSDSDTGTVTVSLGEKFRNLAPGKAVHSSLTRAHLRVSPTVRPTASPVKHSSC
jgi:hypothetical protein